MPRTFKTNTGEEHLIPYEEERFRTVGGQVGFIRNGQLNLIDRQHIEQHTDVNALPLIDISIADFAAGLGAFGRPVNFTNPSVSGAGGFQEFLPRPIPQSGETLKVSASETNPNAGQIISSTRGNISPAPPTPQGVPSGKAGVGGAPILQEGQPMIDPKIQKAQQEIHKAQELQARVNQMLVKQGKQPVPIQSTPTTPQNSPQNAPGQAQGAETTQSTSPTYSTPPEAQEPSIIDSVKSMLREFGITMPSMNQSPVSSAADIYKQFSEMNNLFGMKKDIEDLIKKQTQEIADVNENPWISEGLRQRKVQQISDKYERRLNLLQAAFNRADEDIRFLTGKYLEQVHQTQQNQQDILFKGIDLAEKEIAARRAERRAERKESERVREFDIRESRAEQRDIERTREFKSREKRLLNEFEIREADRAKREQKTDDRELNKKIQHIFDAKAKGENAEDLKKEIDEAVITDAMREYLKRKVDDIYGVSGGGFTFGKLGKKLESLFQYGE